MKRDFTVTCAVLVMTVWVFGRPIGIPSSIEMSSDLPVAVKVFGVFGVLAILRIVLLFFQTLIHAAHNASPDSKTAIIVGHLFLGPFVSIPYYYASRKPKIET